MNAVGTRLRDLIDSGLARWWLAVKIKGRRGGKREESRTRFSLSVENEQADAERDGRPCLARPIS